MAKPYYSHPPEPITNQGNDCLGRIEVNSWFHYPSPLMSRYSNYYPAVPITLPRPNHFITYLGLLSDAQATCTDGTKSAMNEFLWTWHDDTSSELLSNAFSTGFMKTIDLEGPSRGNTTIFHVKSWSKGWGVMDFERYSDDEFCDVAEGILEDIILEAGKRLYDLSTSSDEDNASIRCRFGNRYLYVARLNKITQQLSGIQYMNQANNMKRHIRDISSGKTSLSQLV